MLTNPSSSSTLSNKYLLQSEHFISTTDHLNYIIQNDQIDNFIQFLQENELPSSILSTYVSTIIESHRIEMLKILLQYSDVNSVIESTIYNQKKSDKVTLLMFSIISNNVEMFDVIMTFNPNILLQDINQRNAATYAILFHEDNDSYMLETLLERNPYVVESAFWIKDSLHNLLTISASEEKRNMLEILLRCENIDINFQIQPERLSALHIAVERDNCDIVNLLLKNKKCNRLLKNVDNKTAFNLAKESKGNVYYKFYVHQHECQKNYTMKRNMKKNDHSYIVIPLELTNDKAIGNSNSYQSLSSMIEIGEGSRLCININQSEEIITKQINDTNKQIEDKTKFIEQYEKKLQEIDLKIEEKNKKLSMKDEELRKYKERITHQQNHMNSLLKQANEYGQLIKSHSNPTYPINFVTKKYDHHPNTEVYIIQSLQKDLIEYSAYVKDCIGQKQPIINDLLKIIQEIINDINPDYTAKLYGSYCTGLCLPWSDIDIVLVHKGNYPGHFPLGRLYSKLVGKPWITCHSYIEATTIPLIKLTTGEPYNFQMDISVQSDNHFGLKCVELVKDYLLAYPILEPIVLALKTLLNQGNMNNPYKGGLSSYGIILMIVSFVQNEITQNNYAVTDIGSVADIFLKLLCHYGIRFDYKKYAVAVYKINERNNYDDKESMYSFATPSHDLMIIDPLNKQNNVAKSAYNFMNIKMSFLVGFMVAHEECECGCHYTLIENAYMSTEHCILKRIFNSVKRISEANKNL